ncbi:hypothetical protein GW915_13795 [bacterium]|nr:hypothetical protein [bacterium]
MKAKLSSITIVMSAAITMANPIELPSIQTPNWNFSNDSSDLSGSLVFDQPFDKKSYRPYPKVAAKNSNEDAVAEQTTSSYLSQSPYIKNKDLVIEEDLKASELKPEQASNDFLIEAEKEEEKATPAEEKAKPAAVPLAQAAAIKKVVNSTPVKDETSPALESMAPKVSNGKAALWILDQDAFSAGQKHGITDATVYWVHPQANIASESDQNGHAFSPLNKINSARFVVIAPGYIPAIGYGLNSQVTTVLLHKESRAKSVSKGLMLEAGESLILGKILDEKLSPVKEAIFDLSDPLPAKTHYSARAGIFSRKFNPAPTQTVESGDFALVNLGPWIQYVMPTVLPDTEWPASIVNLEGIAETIERESKGLRATEMSIVITPGNTYQKSVTVSDSMYGVKPETAIHATIGGQRGVLIPDETGALSLKDLGARGFVDLLDIKARGYLDTWISFASHSWEKTADVALFTEQQLRSLFTGVNIDLKNNGVILGKVSAKNFPAHNIDVEVYDSFGQKLDADRVHYFETDLFVKDGVLRFAVNKVPSGEWHVVLRNSENSDIYSMDVVRVEKRTVSQVEF